jgi:ABC-2 type transport system ATP-binding protein
LISVSNLRKTYPGGTVALDDVSFTIERGEVCGYLGANGAGKTTTVKILTGMLSADSGTVRMNDIDILSNPQKIKKFIGYVPETGAVFQPLTPYEFLEFVCKIYDMDDKVYPRRILDFLELFDLRRESNTPMAAFSKGMRQKVLLVSSLIHNPGIIFWDEPLSGLDYQTMEIVRNLVGELSAAGKTFFYCSHLLGIVEKTCSRILILKSGKIVYDQGSETAASLEDIFRRYINSVPVKEKITDILK